MFPEVFAAGLLWCGATAMVLNLAVPLGRAIRSRRWKRTRGRILSSEIRQAFLPGPYGGPAGTPRVRYRYTVREQEYEATRINFAGFSRSQALRTWQRLRPGHHVRIWYNPRDPHQATLDRRVTGAQILLLLVSLLIWAFLSLPFVVGFIAGLA